MNNKICFEQPKNLVICSPTLPFSETINFMRRHSDRTNPTSMKSNIACPTESVIIFLFQQWPKVL